MRALVTGGCGFIGSNFIEYLLGLNSGIEVINLDKQTYAGKGRNIEHMKISQNYRLIKGDIADKSLVERVFSEQEPDLVFNFAAESHVDRSIEKSEDFVKTNVLGATNLLDFSLKSGVKRFIQISTDEVYGSATEGSFSEEDRLNPASPYASSKASAELIALSYFRTHCVPVIITRSANNYGKYQFPEKLLPLFITNLIQGKKVPLMWSEENPGLNVRDWLHVRDNCRAIWFVANNGLEGEVYNIPGENEETNIEMTRKILSRFNLGEDMIQHVEHRKGHDFRYSISGEKLKALGFRHRHKDLDLELKEVIEWYQQNEEWWGPLKV